MLVDPPHLDPQVNHLEGLANAIIKICTFIEVEVVGIIRAMEQKLVLRDSPFDDHQQVLKGSLLTDAWNKLARFDDAYVAHLTINDEEHLLWEVYGLNPYNLKITNGRINWHWMKNFQTVCEMDMIGLHFFAKLLMQFMLAVPIYRQQHKYSPPMPATYMHNYLVIAMTCPFICTFTPVLQILQKYYQTFQCQADDDGSARWLSGYTLSWKTAVVKILHKQTIVYDLSREYTPLVPFEQRNDVGIRVVELFKSPLGTVVDTAAVIELVYFNNWSKIVRFAVIDIESLYLAFEDANKLTWPITVYDEIDWIQLQNTWLETQPGETTAMDLHRVDFRNSSQWGTKVKEGSL